mmetsp:Transcript_40066/g.63355  ORF Transcript_40066/g.63355 Transcript_40066/m.63355 type:complete len:218 (-) Transcript_40066:53-706(-)
MRKLVAFSVILFAMAASAASVLSWSVQASEPLLFFQGIGSDLFDQGIYLIAVLFGKYADQIIALGWIGVFISFVLFILRFSFVYFIRKHIEKSVQSLRRELDVKSFTVETRDSSGFQEIGLPRISRSENSIAQLVSEVKELRKSMESVASQRSQMPEVSSISSRLDKVVDKLRMWRKEWTVVKAMVIATYENNFPEDDHRLSIGSDSSDFCSSLQTI